MKRWKDLPRYAMPAGSIRAILSYEPHDEGECVV
jgi:hypothetical protein